MLKKIINLISSAFLQSILLPHLSHAAFEAGGLQMEICEPRHLSFCNLLEDTATVILGVANASLGEDSFVLGSCLNRASGENSAVIFSCLSDASGEQAEASFGISNLAWGQKSQAYLGIGNLASGDLSTAGLGCLNWAKGDKSVATYGCLQIVSGEGSKAHGFCNYISGNNTNVIGFCNYVTKDNITYRGCFYYPFVPIKKAAHKAFKRLKMIRWDKIPRTYFKAITLLERPLLSFPLKLELINLLQATYHALKAKKQVATLIKKEVYIHLLSCLDSYPRLVKELATKKTDSLEIQACYQKLRDLTDGYIALNFAEEISPSLLQEQKAQPSKDLLCRICLNPFQDHEESIVLSCSHKYHTSCLQRGLELSLTSEAGEPLPCVEESCSAKSISLPDLCSIIKSAKCIVLLQKYLIEQVSCLKLCPHCQQSLCKEHPVTQWEASCSICQKFSCFKCGNLPHRGKTCGESFYNKEQLHNMIKAIASQDTGRFGLCPYCYCLLEKLSGCDSMKCGDNWHPGEAVSKSAKDHGCGKLFQWSERIKISAIP